MRKITNLRNIASYLRSDLSVHKIKYRVVQIIQLCKFNSAVSYKHYKNHYYTSDSL